MISTFGLTKVFADFAIELRSLLSNGVTYNNQQFKFDFNSLVGDALGLHELLCLNTCFSNGHICARCTATFEEIQQNPPFTVYLKRNLHQYREARINNYKGESYGIKGESIFIQFSEYFNIFDKIHFDLMHVFPEGFVPKIASLMFESSQINVDLLKSAMQSIKWINSPVRIIFSSSAKEGKKYKILGSAQQV